MTQRKIWRAALATTGVAVLLAPAAHAGINVNVKLDPSTTAVLAGLDLSAARDERQVLAVYGDEPYGTTPTDTVQFLKTRVRVRFVGDDLGAAC